MFFGGLLADIQYNFSSKGKTFLLIVSNYFQLSRCRTCSAWCVITSRN